MPRREFPSRQRHWNPFEGTVELPSGRFSLQVLYTHLHTSQSGKAFQEGADAFRRWTKSTTLWLLRQLPGGGKGFLSDPKAGKCSTDFIHKFIHHFSHLHLLLPHSFSSLCLQKKSHPAKIRPGPTQDLVAIVVQSLSCV